MGVIFKNNVMYNGGDTLIQPTIYSEEEREVGVWTDGKPLYQKTVDCGYLPNRTTKSVSFEVNNIDKILYINGIAYYSSGGHSLPLPYCDDASSTGNILVDANSNGTIRLICQADRSAYYGYVTLQYTKTTDTPGYGKYAPSGVPAVHYSENEQVVGTDTDGSTVYEITYVGDMSIPIQTWGGTGIYISGNLISVDGYITRDGEPIPIGNFGTTIASTWILRDGEIKVQMTEYNTGEIYRLKRMTIRYTKTTS